MKRIAILAFFAMLVLPMAAQEVMSPEQLLSLKYVYGAQLNPDGDQVLYTVLTPRTANEKPGSSHRKYYLHNLKTNEAVEYFTEYRIGAPQWSPDGSQISFLHREEGGETQVWSMPAGGGEKQVLTAVEGGVSTYHWNPNGKGMAFIRRAAASDKEKELKKRGYGFIFFEENLKNDELYYGEFNEDGVISTLKKLTEGVQVWSFVFNHEGSQIAAGISPQNLVDHKYMFQKIYTIDLASGEQKQVSKNEGKLGNFSFSSDDSKLAYAAALNINDHQVSQAFVTDLSTGEVSNYTPEAYKGHVSWVGWKNAKELVYLSSEGVNSKFYSYYLSKKKRTLLLDGAKENIVFQSPQFDTKFKSFVFSGSTSSDRVNLYTWSGKGGLNKITNVNPTLENVTLGEQKVIQFEARDGLQIEGILMLPVGYEEGKKYPLIVYVHGGPESHHSNAWLSSYSTPGQLMTGKGYMVAYFNYRASTGYGVDFALKGLGDPAGAEFDDIADGIEHLIANYGVDRERVGLGGGSYGGYASAWFATYYTQYVKAVAMFVGISDLISKRGTTDIPYEEMYVHSGKSLEEQWEMNLKRSPIYHAHKSKTATLIYGGAADTRVHPSQSMELYRRMKVNDHPAVRLVQYPGEGHGNRMQVGQIDVLYRQVTWFDWYVRDLKPLDGEMPPLDLSELYGLDWE